MARVQELPTNQEAEQDEQKPKQQPKRKSRQPYTGEIPEVCSVKMFSEILGVAESSVRDGMKKGKIPYSEIGNRKLPRPRRFLGL